MIVRGSRHSSRRTVCARARAVKAGTARKAEVRMLIEVWLIKVFS